MFNLDKHREDFVKLVYDLLKAWIILAFIGPLLTGKLTNQNIILISSGSFFLLISAIILREGGRYK